VFCNLSPGEAPSPGRERGRTEVRDEVREGDSRRSNPDNSTTPDASRARLRPTNETALDE